MADRLLDLGHGFWNVRGSFRIGGIVDIGTQASLVRLADGRFVWLDAYTCSDAVERDVRALTRGGQDIHAILNLHPFHTVHVAEAHRRYPHAALYGTSRHIERAPDLPWAPETVDSAAMHERFADDLEFSVPRGVDFISRDSNVHFSSVLAWHPGSRTIHVDDTLSYTIFPRVARWISGRDTVRWHPALAQALQRTPGAAAAFHGWATDLADRWSDATNLCAAHTHALRGVEAPGIRDRILAALDSVASTLSRHTSEHG